MARNNRHTFSPIYHINDTTSGVTFYSRIESSGISSPYIEPYMRFSLHSDNTSFYDTNLSIIVGEPTIKEVKKEVIKYVPKIEYKEVTVVKEVPTYIYIKEDKNMFSLTSIGSIITIVVIVVVVNKFLMPLLNWRFLIKAFVGLAYKPYKREAAEIRKEWKIATKTKKKS